MRRNYCDHNNEALGEDVTVTPDPSFPVGDGHPIGGNHVVTSEFGWREIFGGWQFHQGIDVVSLNTPPHLFAVVDGVIEIVSYDINGWGHWFHLRDPITQYRFLYSHMDNQMMSQGQTVTKGQVVGIMGSSGNATGPHLCFEVIRPDGIRVNPRLYFDFHPTWVFPTSQRIDVELYKYEECCVADHNFIKGDV